MDYIYDLETYPNIFTMAVGAVGSNESWLFEISDRRDDSQSLRSFLKKLYVNKNRMIGFNNVGFDYPVLHLFMRDRGVRHGELYNKAMEIIHADDDDRFSHIIFPNKMFIEQIDLYKIHHFDNLARSTSLKMLEFNMRSDNIEDLPFPPGKELTDDEKDVLCEYNAHDVKQTHLFYLETLNSIHFREVLTERYGRNFMNHNDTKIGKDYFIMELEKEMPGSCYTYGKGGKRKINQTRRKYIDLGDIILPYVHFERPEFKTVLEWFKRQRITETKGVFSNIPDENLGELANHCQMLTKKKKFPSEPTQSELDLFYKEHPKGWVEEKLLKSGKVSHYGMWRVAKNLNTVVDGFQFDFGTGGIHGAVDSTILESDNDEVVKTYDVSSYYPNLSIVNRLYPEHLGEKFCDVYEDVYNQRRSYGKDAPENAMMKLALNGTYGASNDKYSPFYDPRFTMSITVNGQLLLCMLAERLMRIEGLRIVMINTDGLEFIVPRKYEKLAHSHCEEWEEITGLNLEGGTYSKLFIMNVNNYLAVMEE